MSKLSYWERRQVEDTYRYFREAEVTADQISKVYLKASRYLSMKSDEVFERYQTKHRLSEAKARQLINTMQDKASLDELMSLKKNCWQSLRLRHIRQDWKGCGSCRTSLI